GRHRLTCRAGAGHMHIVDLHAASRSACADPGVTADRRQGSTRAPRTCVNPGRIPVSGEKNILRTRTNRAHSPLHRERVTATGPTADLSPEVSTGIMARERTTVAQAALKLVGKDDGDKQRALEAATAQIDRAGRGR